MKLYLVTKIKYDGPTPAQRKKLPKECMVLADNEAAIPNLITDNTDWLIDDCKVEPVNLPLYVQ